MSAVFEVKLRVDTEDNVWVESHHGAVKFDGSIKPLAGQRGVSCTIASCERLRVFFGAEAETSPDRKIKRGREAELIQRPVKEVLSIWPLDYEELKRRSFAGLEALSYTAFEEVFKNPAFIKEKTLYNQTHPAISALRFYQSLSLERQALLSLFTLMDKLDSEFDFKNLEWSIKDGFKGLQRALREHGQIIFQGKYGKCFHGIHNTLPYDGESSPDRDVFFFKKATLKSSPWTHCVVIEQAKMIDGKPYVFFRDPYDELIPGETPRVYMLSYSSFVERISDKYGNTPEESTTFGLVRV